MRFLLLLLFIVTGCQAPKYTFRLAQTYLDDPAAPNNVVVEHAQFELGYEGMKTNDGAHQLQFDMRIENTGGAPLSVQPASYALLDDDNRRFSQNWAGNSAETFTVLPRSALKFSLFFRVPGDYNFDYTGSLRLVWNYQTQGKTWKRVSKFIKHVVEYRYYDTYPYYPYHPYAPYHPLYRDYPCYHDQRFWYGTSIFVRP